MNSSDTRIQQPKKVEQKQPEKQLFIGKPKMEEHTPSFSTSENSLQGASSPADTCSKVSQDFVQ